MRAPLGGILELTRRCNHRCRHCYNNLPAADTAALAAEMDTTPFCRLLDELAEAGCVWLLLTGGETLLRPDFLEIYGRAKENGFLVILFTKATLLISEMADHLARRRPFSIEVTLDGATRANNEAVTGILGSFGRSLGGSTTSRRGGLPLKLKSAVLTTHRHEVWEMKRIAEQDLGLSFRFEAPHRDCSQDPLLVGLTPE